MLVKYSLEKDKLLVHQRAERNTMEHICPNNLSSLGPYHVMRLSNTHNASQYMC